MGEPMPTAVAVSSAVKEQHHVDRGDQVCDTCLIAMRLLEDALCDDGAVAFVGKNLILAWPS